MNGQYWDLSLPLAFLFITLLLCLMHQVSERGYSGLRAKNHKNMWLTCCKKSLQSLLHVIIAQGTGLCWTKKQLKSPNKSKSSINKNSITSALQTGTLKSLLQVEEVSLCRHQLHPQRNWQAQAGGEEMCLLDL